MGAPALPFAARPHLTQDKAGGCGAFGSAMIHTHTHTAQENSLRRYWATHQGVHQPICLKGVSILNPSGWEALLEDQGRGYWKGTSRKRIRAKVVGGLPPHNPNPLCDFGQISGDEGKVAELVQCLPPPHFSPSAVIVHPMTAAGGGGQENGGSLLEGLPPFPISGRGAQAVLAESTAGSAEPFSGALQSLEPRRERGELCSPGLQAAVLGNLRLN